MKNPLNKYAMPKNWLKPTNFDLICGPFYLLFQWLICFWHLVHFLKQACYIASNWVRLVISDLTFWFNVLATISQLTLIRIFGGVTWCFPWLRRKCSSCQTQPVQREAGWSRWSVLSGSEWSRTLRCLNMNYNYQDCWVFINAINTFYLLYFNTYISHSNDHYK